MIPPEVASAYSIHKDPGKEAKPSFDVPALLLREDLIFINLLLQVKSMVKV